MHLPMSVPRRSDVGVREIVAYKQQRFTCELCERVRKAIAEIELGRMAAAFAEIAIGIPCNSSLEFGHRPTLGRLIVGRTT